MGHITEFSKLLDDEAPCQLCQEIITLRDSEVCIHEQTIACPCGCGVVFKGYQGYHISCLMERLRNESAGIRAYIAVRAMEETGQNAKPQN